MVFKRCCLQATGPVWAFGRRSSIAPASAPRASRFHPGHRCSPSRRLRPQPPRRRRLPLRRRLRCPSPKVRSAPTAGCSTAKCCDSRANWAPAWRTRAHSMPARSHWWASTPPTALRCALLQSSMKIVNIGAYVNHIINFLLQSSFCFQLRGQQIIFPYSVILVDDSRACSCMLQ